MRQLSIPFAALLLAVGGCGAGGGKGGVASVSAAAASGSAEAAGSAVAVEEAVAVRAGTVLVTGSVLTAEVPAGFAAMGADMPGLDDNARAHMAAGDIFLANRQNHTLVARGRAGVARDEDDASCAKLSAAMAQAMGGTLVDAGIVTSGPAAKACRTDIRLGAEGVRGPSIARSFVFRVNARMQAVVLCVPFAEGSSSGACAQFAASVKAK